MQPEAPARLEHARAAPSDEINSLVYDVDENTLLALLENPGFLEKHAEVLAARPDVSAAVLMALAQAQKGKWMACESVRLRLAQHPHSPKRIALAAVRQMFLFDLVRLCFSPATPPDIRRLAEESILARVPHLPIGEKLTLARRGPSRVAAALLAEGHPQAVKLALANVRLTESQLLKTLAKDNLREDVVAAIATHPKWSRLYNIRVALMRNPSVLVECVHGFICDLALRDLTDLARLHEISPEMRKVIARELELRKAKSETESSSADAS